MSTVASPASLGRQLVHQPGLADAGLAEHGRQHRAGRPVPRAPARRAAGPAPRRRSTRGASRRTGRGRAPIGAASSRNRPSPAGSTSTAPAASRRVWSPTRISPAAASSASSTAWPTASPAKPDGSGPPTRASPVARPTRMRRARPRSWSRAAASASSAPRAASAAWAARRASSSCRVGTPKTPTMRWPTDADSFPPCRSRVEPRMAWARSSTTRSASGSSPAPEPEATRSSAQSTVTGLRAGTAAAGGGRRRGRPQRGVVAQDRRLQLAKGRRRLQAELLQQQLPDLAVGLEGLGLAAAAVQGEHELAAEPLAQRMLADQALQLADELAAGAKSQVGLDPFLQADQAQLVEPGDLGLGEGLVAEVGQGRSPPQLQGQPQGLGGLGGGAVGQGLASLGEQPLEAAQVDLVGEGAEQVARRPRHQPPLGQRPPQPRHGRLERVGRARRGVLPPQLQQDPLAGHDLVGVQHQQGEHGPLAGSPVRDQPPAVRQLERTQEANLHRSSRAARWVRRAHCPATGSGGTTAACLGSCQPAVSARAQAPVQQRRGPPLDQGGTHVEAHARARAGRHAGGPELGHRRRRPPAAAPQPERGRQGVPGGERAPLGQPVTHDQAVQQFRAASGPRRASRSAATTPSSSSGRASGPRSSSPRTRPPSRRWRSSAGRTTSRPARSPLPPSRPRTARPAPRSPCSSPSGSPPPWPSASTPCPSAARPARPPTPPSDHPPRPDGAAAPTRQPHRPFLVHWFCLARAWVPRLSRVDVFGQGDCQGGMLAL